ncbi:oligopeptidase A. Metallo peptidase. MEROPS family M03A [Sulfurimonas denitrificans DSM 1251]|uniref:oligopeptidase A n=1 Tax=Sulfurimonas denitrificans (strain ATCC 33889 / DSM 1251) TaxID=326298 RepID=Q30SP0_SULDN|nr:M3 family metallopeptidase [Sulfurimonas denitrificans]ABB43991.1 oligopeptidase A. Metallo peptidase. MEROPS family M03A [Sulfurimonas denitrificans DSM 1251]
MSKFLELRVDLGSFIEELNVRLEKNNKSVEKLLKIKEKNFANFVKPLEMMDEKLEQFFTQLSHLNSVKNSAKTQKIYAASLPIVTDYSTKLSQNIDIYNAYKEIFKNEQKSLNQEQKRVLELNILGFELSGAHLDEKIKKRLQEINLKKSTLSNDFSQNLLNATNEYKYIVTDIKDVEGIPQSDLANAMFKEDGVTKYKFTLQMPSYIAYMTYGKNENIREELYRSYVTRAPQNALIIDELLSLKNEMSRLLGFDNYASYSLASKMATDESSVIEFLEELISKSKPQAKKELRELQEITKKPLNSFDTAFYSELLKKEKYNIDEEEYRPYFEQNSVLDGTFEFLNKLFKISFKKNSEELWDKKALSYDLYVDGILKSRLYLDLEARKGKQGGAWMNNFSSHHIDEKGKEHLASAVIVCNFPPSKGKTPSLLRHDDVVTLFHEMGHALHHMLSEVNESGVSGVNGVEWDAVEFPSQFLENFAYEPKVLKLFATHYKTKEIIPAEMIEKLVKSKNFQSALGMLRQLEFSIFDFKLHAKLHKGSEVQELLDSIREQTALIKPPSYNKFQNGFSHIFAGGYAAGYYSYKWAEVLSADAFFSVVDEGIFDSLSAKKYLEIILRSGGSKSMDILYKEFMGTQANPENLLRLNGII